MTELYTASYTRVIHELRRIKYLNITVDETSNINYLRFIVVTITTREKYWFYVLKNLRDQSLTAKDISNWIFKQLEAFLSAVSDQELNWKSINSLSTDTCSVMRLV